jgi:hypothetical protein
MKFYYIALVFLVIINNNMFIAKIEKNLKNNKNDKNKETKQVKKNLIDDDFLKSFNDNNDNSVNDEGQNKNSDEEKVKAEQILEETNMEKNILQYNNGFSSLNKNIFEYCTNITHNPKKVENIIMEKTNKYGSMVAVQFYNNYNLINVSYDLKNETNNNEILGDHFLLFYQNNKQGELLQYNLILNYSSSQKRSYFFSKSLIKKLIKIHGDLTVLIPENNLTIGHLIKYNLYPFLMTYKNNSKKFSINEEDKIILPNEDFKPSNEIHQHFNGTINSFMDDVFDIEDKAIINKNLEISLEDNLKNLPEKYLIFQYLLYLPSEKTSKNSSKNYYNILWVYTDLENKIIKMEVHTTLIGKNYDNKDFIYNIFFKTIIPGKPASNFFYELNNIVMRNPLMELRVGVMNKHHNFNECKDNFFMVVATRNPLNNIIMSIRRILKCCEKKCLNLF